MGARLLRRPAIVQRTSTRRRSETLKERSARAEAIAARLARAYPEIVVPLKYRNRFELLVATSLSAQCTDAAVNRITPELFRRYPDPATLAQAATEDVEKIIRTLGLFRAKARSLKDCAQQLVEKFDGQVPTTMETLTRLAGVGRKTANVILGYVFGVPVIVVDTHCRRVSRRLGLTRAQDPKEIEGDLNRLLRPEEWTGFSHRLIIHGRRVCYARKPDCTNCVLLDLCPTGKVIVS
jgi:endonuclease-3